MSDSTANNASGPGPGKATGKAANAAYPVDEAELSTQQERLRKAAAAGAHALKSPLASVLSRTPLRPSAAAQDAQSPAPATASTQAVPNAGPAPSPEVPAPPTATRAQANESEPLLAELSKISALADTQRKLTRWSLICLTVLLALVGFALMQQRFRATSEEANPQPDWSEVERNLRGGDFDKAIALGEELIQKTPLYPEAHERLAGAYLAAGRLEKAREHYAEAFRLFPSEENHRRLSAIETRSNAEKP